MSSIYDDALAAVGVNVAQFSLLRHIQRHGPVSLTELGSRTELDRSTVGRNVKVLERMGLVEAAKTTDHREAVFAVSPVGRQALEDGAPLWDEAQARIEAKLGPDTAQHLRDVLAAL